MDATYGLYFGAIFLLGLVALSPLLMKRRSPPRSDRMWRALMHPHSTWIIRLIATLFTITAFGLLLFPYLMFTRPLPQNNFADGMLFTHFVNAVMLWGWWLLLVVGRWLERPRKPPSTSRTL